MSIKYNGPVVLIIMDGVGLSDRTEGNAVKQAHLETFSQIIQNHPTLELGAAGHYVGIPDGDMGNSEVGHNAIGTGEIIAQNTKAVDEAILGGKAFKEPTWQNAIQNVKDNHSTLHFIGIFSDGGVHSDIRDLFKMMEQAHSEGIERIRVHALVDGRDTPPQSEPKYIQMFEQFVHGLGDPDYRIASGGGRMYITADRYENDWPMVERGWRTHVLGEGRQFPNATAAVEAYRAEDPDVQDQYMHEFVIVENGQPIGTINDGDSVIYFDFRADRAIQISMAFTYDDFPYFDRIRRPKVNYVGMMEYNNDTHVPALTLVPPISFKHSLPRFLSEKGIKQYAISETVKFGHITYYFEGNDSELLPGETELEIQSDEDSELFVQRPWMKSAEITDNLLAALESKEYQFLRVNYPNGDMVGHFAELEPTIIALEAVDIALRRVIETVDKLGGITIVTADHGNAEELIDETGGPKTSHTTNKVLCTLVDNTENRDKYQLIDSDFGLANLTSTISLLLGLDPDPNWLPPIIKLND